MAPHVPKYVSPKRAAESRAQRRAVLFWIAVALPVLFAILLYGYSDQAPAPLRNSVIALDGALGHPILWLLTAVTGR